MADTAKQPETSRKDRPLPPKLGALLDFTAEAGRITLRNFSGDRCLVMAASLSYTSLLAMVPLIAISFAIITAFPVFSEIKGDLENMIFANLVPHAGDAIQGQITEFAANTRKLTAVGVVGLAVTALLLLNAIETAFNTIWKVGTRRSLLQRLLVFWAIITLGPLLVGASFSMSSYIFTLTQRFGSDYFSGIGGLLTRLMPFALETLALSLLFIAAPNRRVRVIDGLIGGAIAALFFELGKKGFAVFLVYAPTYQVIYGALATIPIFLVWMYLSWAFVLFGAEVAHGLDSARRKQPPAERLRETDQAAAD
ncbi:YihY family inner membrane protein [Oceanibacterium hippocampi]|uniref:UPF0761 membrane protein OCH7691_00305 n=1 Tax=Oceanibacterium hippocampi TaxID=745714 RepID=A0A1Y5RHT9_9PROT|nr:YihY family inner membrane protein [Oceanibacterium hippocampi]SLN15202.1 hypothetical protein OCH7691_00305 [Oceanibacterium hippocampi]